ncbi:hypothetical protein [Streptomyces sp. NPDC046939]|uniref:hypothetical protein n=1 Tax=Streptomyces sp. NPDC046939 TaxID=3155376 RepID=UPI0033D9AFD2
MTDHRLDDRNEPPVPRDMPDQLAGEEDAAEGLDLPGERGDDVPDTDEAGTRRRGAESSDPEDADAPGPDESPA